MSYFCLKRRGRSVARSAEERKKKKKRRSHADHKGRNWTLVCEKKKDLFSPVAPHVWGKEVAVPPQKARGMKRKKRFPSSGGI